MAKTSHDKYRRSVCSKNTCPGEKEDDDEERRGEGDEEPEEELETVGTEREGGLTVVGGADARLLLLI